MSGESSVPTGQAATPGLARVQPRPWAQTLVVVLAALTVIVAFVLRLRGERLGTPELMVLGCFFLAMLAGEALRLDGQDHPMMFPLSGAATAGLALAGELDGRTLGYGAAEVVIAQVAAMLLGAAWLQHRTGGRPRVHHYAVRLLVLSLVAVVYREVPLGPGGRTLVAAATDGTHVRWQVALLMLAVLLAATVLAFALQLLLRPRGGHRARWHFFQEDVRSALPVTLAAMSAAVVVALGLRALSLFAVPLFLTPLVLMGFAIQRQRRAGRARQQSIAALSRMTDLAGYTREGHSERVAALCDVVGRAMHLTDRELVDLEAAALLHDIGQVALRDPIPGGATVGLAPVDQERIADDGAAIVRRTEAMDRPATIISEHPTPFRILREEGRPLSRAARILKVCNAFDDLGGTRGDRDAALERILLGLGYEYDPEVVDALTEVTERVTRAA
ncbi:HD domain-containing protein [Barrientosiimonas humi]|uniref:HD domain-containing protein n=2 Tax=Barrientosiimonas TaxID=1535207 RepID=A0A542X9A7_9MICO|nr:HD domain-containing phosphohydrolase [Barrientosiimonas humi]TQL32433.1 HD domain-containing protein [Barrientosiimonas humi]CAG7572424.1 hypothetical protein BH39T_PBIAJDOK_01039 [Barrientosiimonas humi]